MVSREFCEEFTRSQNGIETNGIEERSGPNGITMRSRDALPERAVNWLTTRFEVIGCH